MLTLLVANALMRNSDTATSTTSKITKTNFEFPPSYLEEQYDLLAFRGRYQDWFNVGYRTNPKFEAALQERAVEAEAALADYIAGIGGLLSKKQDDIRRLQEDLAWFVLEEDWFNGQGRGVHAQGTGLDWLLTSPPSIPIGRGEFQPVREERVKVWSWGDGEIVDVGRARRLTGDLWQASPFEFARALESERALARVPIVLDGLLTRRSSIRIYPRRINRAPPTWAPVAQALFRQSAKLFLQVRTFFASLQRDPVREENAAQKLIIKHLEKNEIFPEGFAESDIRPWLQDGGVAVAKAGVEEVLEWVYDTLYQLCEAAETAGRESWARRLLARRGLARRLLAETADAETAGAENPPRELDEGLDLLRALAEGSKSLMEDVPGRMETLFRRAQEARNKTPADFSW